MKFLVFAVAGRLTSNKKILIAELSFPTVQVSDTTAA